MSRDKGIDLVCSNCFGNEVIRSFIRKNGDYGRCYNDSHTGRHKVISRENLIECIDQEFRSKYQEGEEEIHCYNDSDNPIRGQYGEDLTDCLADLLECDGELVEFFARDLTNSENIDITGGEQHFYDHTFSKYESIENAKARHEDEYSEYLEYLYKNSIDFKWSEFCEHVKYTNRFFYVRQKLDDLFGDPKSYSLEKWCPIYTLEKGEAIYRARSLENINFEDIKKNLLENLGSPPRDKAASGRMNPQHISVFYGAFHQDVAVVEIRPFIQEKIALGKFILKENIKVFDFTIFDRVFNDEYDRNLNDDDKDTRYQVIKCIQKDLSKPISSKSKTSEYVPTQIVSGYIREHFGVDAIIYFSSLISESKKAPHDRRNIIIFSGNEKLGIEQNDVELKIVSDINYSIVDDLI